MRMRWTSRTPLRPDRYLDWDLINRPAGYVPGWCSALLQVWLGPEDDLAAHLKWLARHIADQQAPGHASSMKMHAEEYALLDARIAEVSDKKFKPAGPDDTTLAFYVYMRESVAYTSGGQYAGNEHFEVRLVGPPIDSLVFNDRTHCETRRMPLARTAVLDLIPRKVVAIGVIDDGLAFAHDRFRVREAAGPAASDRTRIERIWLQDIEREEPDHRVAFGRRLHRKDIDALFEKSIKRNGRIDEGYIYREVGAIDFAAEGGLGISHRVAHGTHVMDLACGFDPLDPAGRLRPILAVQLPDPEKLDRSGVTLATYVLQGLRQIMLWADTIEDDPLPLVVNFSYGLLAGPKDGSHFLEREIDRLVEYRNRTVPTAVVLPSGNSYATRTVAGFRLAPGASDTIDWIVLPDDSTRSALEIWCNDPGGSGSRLPIEVMIEPPVGPACHAQISSDGRCALLEAGDGSPVCAVYADNHAGTNAATASRVLVLLNPTKALDQPRNTSPSGTWKVTIRNVSTADVTCQLFIQRGFRRRGRQSYFDHPAAHARDPARADYTRLGRPGHEAECPITDKGSLSAIANGKQTIVVGAAVGATRSASVYASCGPTAGRPDGPHFSAVADESTAFPGILAAGSRSGAKIALNGSSVSSPQVARRLAECGVDVNELKNKYTPGARQDQRLGFGIIPQSISGFEPKRRRDS